jgi:hypothetical protein
VRQRRNFAAYSEFRSSRLGGSTRLKHNAAGTVAELMRRLGIGSPESKTEMPRIEPACRRANQKWTLHL